MTDGLARMVRSGMFGMFGLLVLALPTAFVAGLPYISGYYLQQDLAVALVLAAVFVATRFSAVRDWLAAIGGRDWTGVGTLGRPWFVAAIAVAIFALGVLGGWVLFRFYPLSMDEFWARADGTILAAGAPMARIPEEWRPFASALMPMFTRLLPEPGLWASSYLPVNAIIQLVFGVFASPIMAGLSIVLCARIARRLMPDEPHAPLIAVLVLASSSQFLLTAMTPYAMTGHLFFNLSWLWLFLQRSRVAHLGAMLVAFLAIGLHQSSFFPLFALPFLLEAFLSGRRRVAIMHLCVIAAGFLAWSNYDLFAYWFFDASPTGTASKGSAWLLGKFIEKVGSFEPLSIALMALNLLRFQLWQNPVVVPLVLLVAIPVIRLGGVWRALLAGLVLTTLFMFVVIPFQGHGWGYRYLHGLLGSASLLATYGFFRLKSSATSTRSTREWRGFMAAMLVGALAVLLPLRAAQAWIAATPYVVADAALKSWDADVIVIDAPNHAYAVDLTRNSPLLDNRPKRVYRKSLGPGQLEELCKRYAVRLFDGEAAESFGIMRWTVPGDFLSTYPSNCNFGSSGRPYSDSQKDSRE